MYILLIIIKSIKMSTEENAELNTEIDGCFQLIRAPIEDCDIEAAVAVAVPVPVPVEAAIIARVPHRPPPSFPHCVIVLISFCTLIVGLLLLEVFGFKIDL
jgi:hypothetical protein